MNTELETVFSRNLRYATAYAEFFESYKNGYGKNSTEEELAEFEKFFARDFLNGIENDSDEREVLIAGERLVIRRARIADADFMQSVELEPDNSPWVANWSLGWRIAKLGDEDFLQTVIEKTDGTPIGILIFRGMRNVREKLELKRIALIEKGKGYGKEVLYLAKKLAFDVFETPYLYLGTKETNVRAQSIYKATGFTPDMPDPCTSFHITAEAYRVKESTCFGRRSNLEFQ